MAEQEDSPAVARLRASLGPGSVLTDRETRIIDAMSSNQEEKMAEIRREMRDLISQAAAPTELTLSQRSIDAITAGTRASTRDASNSISVAAKNLAFNLPTNLTAFIDDHPYRDDLRPSPQIQKLLQQLSHVPSLHALLSKSWPHAKYGITFHNILSDFIALKCKVNPSSCMCITF